MGANVKGCVNPNETLVAATFSKVKTYVFALLKIRDGEFGGANPARPDHLLSTIYGCRCRVVLTHLSMGMRTSYACRIRCYRREVERFSRCENNFDLNP